MFSLVVHEKNITSLQRVLNEFYIVDFSKLGSFGIWIVPNDVIANNCNIRNMKTSAI